MNWQLAICWFVASTGWAMYVCLLLGNRRRLRFMLKLMKGTADVLDLCSRHESVQHDPAISRAADHVDRMCNEYYDRYIA